MKKKHEWEVKKPYGICRASLQCELSSQNPHDSLMSQGNTRMMQVGPGPYVTFGWNLIFLKKAFLFLFCFSDTLKWRLHAALPSSKEITEQSQIALLDDTNCWRWERINLVLLCKDWGMYCSIVDVKSYGEKQMRNLCLPSKKREDRPQKATDMEYFAGISLIFQDKTMWRASWKTSWRWE